MNDQNLPRVVSSDTTRSQRIPPGQVETRKWPVLHAGPTPTVDLAAWRLRIWGAVECEWKCSWEEFTSLPCLRVFADMHCVTRWSKLDNEWEGISTREVLGKVRLRPSARFVLVHCAYGFTTNLPLDDFLGEDCLFALKHNGADLTPDHGYPVRLVIPRLYAWKSAKWVRGLEILDHDQAGFWESWENGGYHMRGDPWDEERFRNG